MDPWTQILQAGFEQQNAGNLAQAEQLYRQVLQANPRHATAWHLMALLAYRVKNYQAGVEFASNAIRSDGRQAAFHDTLGTLLYALGQIDNAIASYRQATRLEPAFPRAHNNLGNMLQAKGDLEGAAQCFREAIRLQPTYIDAHASLGVLLQVRGDLAGAEEQLSRVLSLQPNHEHAHLMRANVLRQQGRTAEAWAMFQEAVRRWPDSPYAHCALGIGLQSQGNLTAAVEAYRRAIALDPNYPEGHFNLGAALYKLNANEEALRHLQEAVRLHPAFVEAWLGMTAYFNGMVRPDEALAASQRALQLAPLSATAHNHRGHSLQGQGDQDGAIAAYRRSIELEPTNPGWYCDLLFLLNFHPGYDAATLAAEHRRWAERFAEPLTAASPKTHANSRDPDRKLRIGYLSPHFFLHAVSFFSEPLIAAHDRTRFEVYCYTATPKSDSLTERFRAHCDVWRNIATLDDAQAAEVIRQDGIDILVDLAGHLGGNRLLIFARKPAPVQVTYIGYQNTTGMSAMDYRLTDAHADPPGTTDAYYTERLVRLPVTFFCYARPDDAPAVNRLPALERGELTFASLNHIQKLTPQAIQTWAEILAAVPRSRLIVLAYSPGRFEQHVRNVLAARGVDPARLQVVNKRPRYDYLQLHEEIDIALDSFPFNGHTTICDALWMGVPSIMMEGTTYASRFGGSTLMNLGLADWIARDPREYVALAVRHASDLGRLAELRASLRERMQQSVLMDAAGFARRVEDAYRQMWRQWCERT